MNNVHPIFESYLNSISQGVINKRPNASDDWAALDEMKVALVRHLNAALIECAAISRDLVVVDPDEIMVELRSQFDPSLSAAPIQDCFSDGFAYAHKRVPNPYLTTSKRLPSGVPVGEQ